MADLRQLLTDARASMGRLTPAGLVEYARPDASPLHDRFEWDDAVASERYRQIQAGDLIRRVSVVYTSDEHGPRTVRAFMPVRQAGSDDPHREYIPTEDALRDPFLAEMLLREAEREIASFRQKYGHLREYRDLLRGAIEAA
ncbi:hypothetical protein [Gryllotalpicola protaetiae]|uniref:Uncharacterized protein n=1 Tax=Gryllotalpicola protaetiae TaxID=2419771 RepID=A0A387BVF9_9MICO|nr:hypothetical protein [Gryllotalpicola protaetiae]AYG02381.1 hypothetical protein D7I44_01750 [Gryllotalpicola protaetiae]